MLGSSLFNPSEDRLVAIMLVVNVEELIKPLMDEEPDRGN